jgi:hypothetical protein
VHPVQDVDTFAMPAPLKLAPRSQQDLEREMMFAPFELESDKATKLIRLWSAKE